MKTADIKAGVDYAFRSRLSRNGDNLRWGTRVRVVKVDGVVKDRFNRPSRGVVLVHVNEETGRKEREGREFVAQPKNLVGTWDEKVALDKENEKQRKAGLRVRNGASKNIRALVGKKAPWWVRDKAYSDGSFSTHGDLSVHELDALLQTAYEKGRCDQAAGTQVIFVETDEEIEF